MCCCVAEPSRWLPAGVQLPRRAAGRFGLLPARTYPYTQARPSGPQRAASFGQESSLSGVELVCGEPVVRPVVWVAFSLQNGLVDPITRKVYRCAGYKVKTFSLQRGGRAAKNTKKSMTFWLLLSRVCRLPGQSLVSYLPWK